ncbi:MAPEG family protein [Variovorax sp. PCZ-1]|uniref:MAPEG family protein n=1 Tax=Variovorax sp. PCZ-1 TaxID=2835533 RepID=UPI001BCB911E|nr:MAPEG family protein [Variovorax sp. PCZ-1]MBS7806803.1 MAPEG family protein [Variovorax sp. PCZ-1]
MTNSLLALLGFAAWTLLLLMGIALLRCYYTLFRGRYANSFAVMGEDVSPFSGRLCRAHANCYENLPAFAAIIAVAALSSNAHITEALALWALAARLAQSSVHLISTRNRAVMMRFSLLMVQWVIQLIWIVGLIRILF